MAALPSWVMLERFVFLQDDEKSFPEDSRTSVSGTTSAGASFRVSFILADPPTPSRLYLYWPRGPKQRVHCHAVAAHRNFVLLRVDYRVDESVRFGEVRHDYFVYVADPSSQRTPLLRLLPACTEYDCYFERLFRCMFEPQAVGMLRFGEDEFAVAYLAIRRSTSVVKLDAKLSVLCSSSGNGHSTRAGGEEAWKVKQLPIQYTYKDDDEVQEELFHFKTHNVVPFKNSLCWVDCKKGIVLCGYVCGDSPKLSYIRFPRDNNSGPNTSRNKLYRTLCVTEGGDRLAFIDAAPEDGSASCGAMAPNTAFTITTETLTTTENGDVGWNKDSVVTVDQLLWAKSYTPAGLHGDVMVLPLLSMDTPDAAHLVLYDGAHDVGKTSLVSIDLKNERVLNEVVTDVKGKEARFTDDSDIVMAKPFFFMAAFQRNFRGS